MSDGRWEPMKVAITGGRLEGDGNWGNPADLVLTMTGEDGGEYQVWIPLGRWSVMGGRKAGVGLHAAPQPDTKEE
jgi:hypothetical protein